jgi:hypothetical protein
MNESITEVATMTLVGAAVRPGGLESWEMAGTRQQTRWTNETKKSPKNSLKEPFGWACYVQSVIRRRVIGAWCAGVIAAAGACSNGSKAVLLQQADANRLASSLHVQFTRAADASNRAVMADTDEASAAAAHEAEAAIRQADHDAAALQAILKVLGDSTELTQLESFKTRFAEYRKLDEQILPLAVENTNVKAQRLAFGPAQEAVTAFRQALETAARLAIPKNAAAADALAERATASVLEIQVIEARHIAESDDAAMSKMEASIKASGDTARKSVDTLKGLLPPAAGAPLATAAAALDRLISINAEIVTLSRRNSNVRSLALALGRKRTVTAECSDALQQLEETLASRHFAATR